MDNKIRVVHEALVEVEQLDIKEDSVVFIRIKERISDRNLEQLATQLKKWKEENGLKNVPFLLIDGDAEISCLSPAQMKEYGWVRDKAAMTVKVSLTDTDQFKDILDTLVSVYKQTDEQTREYIETRIEEILSKTHDTKRILEG